MARAEEYYTSLVVKWEHTTRTRVYPLLCKNYVDNVQTCISFHPTFVLI